MAQPDRVPADRRDAAIIIVTFLLLGVLGGVLWSLVVSPAEFTKLADGGSMGEDELSKKFGADGWFVLIGTAAGVLAGLALSWWRSRDALLTSALLVAGSAVAAAVMALVGHLLGPGSTQAALAAVQVGAQVPERLDVDTFIVYLAWPVGVLAGTLFVLLGRAPEPDAGRPSRQNIESASPPPAAG